MPPQLLATADYPARYAVFQRQSDGSLVDITSSETVVTSIEKESIAQAAANGTIVVKQVGNTNIQFLVRQESREVRLALPLETTSDMETSFDREVSATLGKAGCNLGACHGNLHGKGGFRMSLRGDDARFDFDRITNEYGGRRIDVFEPTSSLLLKKATNQIAHQGGQRFEVDSLEFTTMLRWIEKGAKWTDSASLETLEVFPKDIRVAYPNRNSRLIVIASFSDGSFRDVTRWARIEPSIPSGVEVNDDGIITVEKPIDVSFNVSYLNGRAAARVAFLGASEASAAEQLVAVNPIDTLIDQQLTQLHLTAKPLASDSAFVRRAFLVTIGRLPTSSEARDYLSDTRSDKRDLLIERLLADPGFDLMWAMRWSDLLRNEDKVMSAVGAQKLHNWLRDQTATDRSLQATVRDLVSSVGSTYDNPPASFHRTHRDPSTAAESVAQVFLGARIACAKCHNHPFDSWRQDDYYGLAAYFTTIERQQIDNKPKDGLDKHVITGDEIISLAERSPEIMHPGISKMVSPTPLKSKLHLVSNVAAVEVHTQSPLEQLAGWLTEDNPMFDQNMANRIWYQYFGRGIVDPPDDFRDSNPPSNPPLLHFLADELVRSDYSVRQLARLILTSNTFARESAEDFAGPESLPAAPYFAGYPIRRMPAEILLDAIADSTAVPNRFRSGRGEDDELVVVNKAMEMPGVPRKAGFLTTFGKPNRLLDCECERTNQVSLGQSLALLNGVEVREKVVEHNNIIDTFAESNNDQEILEELYLRTLTRYPSEVELKVMTEYIAQEKNRRRAIEDVLWSLINSKEFIMLR